MAYTQSINTETKLIGELGLNNLISSTAGLPLPNVNPLLLPNVFEHQSSLNQTTHA